MLDIITPMSKLTRVSRKVDVANFVAAPGVWIKINDDGSASNVANATPPAVAKLCIGTAGTNAYETNDVEVGRITTLESNAARVSVDSVGFSGAYANPGDYLAVATDTGNEGKLREANPTDTIVAIVEGYNSTTGILTYVIASPKIASAAITTTTAAPTTTTTVTTAAPTTTTTVTTAGP